MSGVIATPTKTPKRRAKPKQTGPSVSDLILKVVSASKSRTGVSLPALKKSLAVSGYDVVKNNSRVKLSVRRLVRSGALLQPKGTGASGSFKINAKKPANKKKKVVRKKKVKRNKVKRVSPKKAAVAKKSPARKKKVKQSPKVKKPVAAKKPVKKSPKTKVAVRSVAMSTRAKDPAKK